MRVPRGLPPPFPLRHEPGWVGAFTRETAQGAMPNGTRVVKCNAEKGDTHEDGTPGVVLGSMSSPKIRAGEVMYFVEWAASPRVAVGVVAAKVRAAAT